MRQLPAYGDDYQPLRSCYAFPDNQPGPQDHLLQILVENLPVAIFAKDAKDGRIIFWNQASAKLFGIPAEAAMGRTDYELFPKEQAEAFRRQDEAILASQALEDIPEELIHCPSLGPRILHTVKTPIFDEHGEPLCLLGISEDITAERQAQDLVSVQRELARSLSATSDLKHALALCLEAALKIPDIDCAAMYLLTPDGNLELATQTGFSQAFVQMASEAAVNQTKLLLVHQGRPVYLEGQAMHTGAHAVHAQEGLHAAALIPIRNDNQIIGCLAAASHTAMEMTKPVRAALEANAHQIGGAMLRLKAEHLSRENERKYRLLAENQKDVVFTVSADGTVTYCSPAIKDFAGYDAREEIGCFMGKYFAREAELARALELLQSAIPEKLPTTFTFLFLPADRPPFPVELTAKGIVAHNRLISVQGVLRDVTERKQAEELLQIQRDVAVALGSTPDLFGGLNRLLEIVCGAGDIDCGGVYLLNPQHGRLDLVAHRGLTGAFLAACPHFQTVAPQALSANQGKPFFLSDTDLPLSDRPALRQEGLAAVAVLPLLHQENIIGLLAFASHVAPEISQANRTLLESVAAQVGGLIAKKRAEDAQGESEEKYRALFEKSSDAILVFDEAGLVECNQAALDMFGYLSKSQLCGKSPAELSPPLQSDGEDSLEAAVQHRAEVLEKGNASFEWMYRRKNGECFPAEVRLNSLPLLGKSVVQATVRDITERVCAEEALQQSEERMELALRGAELGLWDWRRSAGKLVVNERTAEMLGYTLVELSQLLQTGFAQCIHPDDRQFTLANIQALKDGRASFLEIKNRLLTKAGESRWILARGKTMERDKEGKALRMTGTFLDITERVHAEDELQNAHRQLQEIIEFLPNATLVINRDKQVIAWNRAIEVMTGIPKADMIGKGHYAYSLPFYGEPRPILIDLVFEDPSEVIKKYDFIERRGENWIAETFCRGLHGGRGAFLWGMASALYDAHGNLAGAIECIYDITDRKRAESALRQSEAKYRELVENANSIILKMDTQGNVIFFNEFAVSFFGFSEAEIIGKNVVGTIVAPTDSNGRDLLALINDLCENPGKYVANENENIRKTGDVVYIAWTNKLIRDEQGRIEGVLCVGNDLTGRKRLEDQLRQSQKLEAIGRLAGGISHDFNNLLSAVMLFADLAMTKLRPEDPAQAYLTQIGEACQRASDLTRQLLAFSRKQVLEMKLLNPNLVISSLENILRRLISENIELTAKLSPGLGSIKADPSQIEQVVLNLVINARDAMPQGGRLAIETSNVVLDTAFTKTLGEVQPGPYVMLLVSDTGEGMDPQTLNHAFEPFFTTKEKGKGTGLGLSTVYGIIKQHGGAIWVESSKGCGTTFKIFFPLASQEAPGSGSERTAAPAKQGHEKLLVVEDEEMIRTLAANILASCGYRVITARDGEEAVALAEKESGPIDLLLTDVVMPKMNGKELYDRLLLKFPALKALYMSGYADNAISRQTLPDWCRHFLQKPFTVNFLLERVRDALDPQA